MINGETENSNYTKDRKPTTCRDTVQLVVGLQHVARQIHNKSK